MKKVYVMVGIPGSGKSTWIKNQNSDWCVISPDQILEERYNYEWTPERAAEGWAVSFQRFGAELLKGTTIVWDATFTSEIMRSSVLHISKGAGYQVEAVFCDTDLSICKDRNQIRDREPVPDSTIDRMYATLSPPTVDEGFDIVHHIQTGTES